MKESASDNSENSLIHALPGPRPTIVRVRIGDLVMNDSPRLSGIRVEHVRTLTEMVEELPPILVHAGTMRVIDGVHRVHAVVLGGGMEIDATFFDGTAEEAFLLAVKANVAHGMPLTADDRNAAASRIIMANPSLSDRVIAATTGLSARTIAAIRSRTEGGATDTRRGRDGKLRPLSTAEGRLKASRAIQDRPNSSLREIAREAGISVGTVRDVMARIRAGEEPVPERHARPADPMPAGLEVRRDAVRRRGSSADDPLDVAALLDGLRRDPSLRYSEAGRTVLRWLDSSAGTTTRWPAVVDNIPPHCAILVGRIARECGKAWMEFAVQLDRVSADSPPERPSPNVA